MCIFSRMVHMARQVYLLATLTWICFAMEVEDGYTNVFPDLEGIAFCEFDSEIGPRLFCQYPPSVMSNATFLRVYHFLITRRNDLCENGISWTDDIGGGRTYAGYPALVSLFYMFSAITLSLLNVYRLIIRNTLGMLWSSMSVLWDDLQLCMWIYYHLLQKNLRGCWRQRSCSSDFCPTLKTGRNLDP